MKNVLIVIAMIGFISCSDNSNNVGLKLERLAPMDGPIRQTTVKYYVDKLKETTFRFPCGIPEGKGYYVSQQFQDPTMHAGDHLGVDISGNGGGNTDLGDTIYSIGNGVIAFGEIYDLGYISVYHKYNNKIIKAVYYHCDTIFSRTNDYVTKGQPIATIGNRGTYQAHLHFEIASDTTITLGGYGIPDGWIDPMKLFPNFKQKR